MTRNAAITSQQPEQPNGPSRPARYEALRLRAAELFDQGCSVAEVAAACGVSQESARRWRRRLAQDGVAALRRRVATGRPPKLSDRQVEQVRQALQAGALANGFDNDLWTVRRVAKVVARTTGVKLSAASVWRLLTRRLDWSVQRPIRQAKERDEQAIARWVAHEWPRIKKGP